MICPLMSMRDGRTILSEAVLGDKPSTKSNCLESKCAWWIESPYDDTSHCAIKLLALKG